MTFLAPLVGFDFITRDELNDCLVRWGHRMGPLSRPQFGTRSSAHGLRHNGTLVAVVATEPLIATATCELSRSEAVELARVCADRPSLCRVAVRLWREFVLPAYATTYGLDWAISYQCNALHSGNLYRMDGWVPIGRTRSGTDTRAAGGTRKGRDKTVWAWHADPAKRAAKDTRA